MRCLIALLLLGASGVGSALDFRGEFGGEAFAFGQAGAQGQAAADYAGYVQGQWWQSFNDDHDLLTVTPFIRVDRADSERSHADLREASWLHVGDGYELRSGVRQVFWGVTEGAHLVDIVNQTDAVEGVDGKRKLGQPMLNLSIERGRQLVDLFILPGARERSFPGGDGRLRLPLVVDSRLARYQSAQENRHIDLAARWQYSHDNLRLGLSGFAGTAREPELQPVVDLTRLATEPGYQPVLAPYYPLIRQAGLDLQYTQGDLLWKLEAISRRGGSRDYTAGAAGIEYTQVGVLESAVDLGWLCEYLYDSRQDQASTPFEHDLLLGARLNFNDAAGSDLLASVIVDHKTQEQLFSVEARHRLRSNLLLKLELRQVGHSPAPQTAYEFMTETDSTHKLRPLAQDSFLRAELIWFF